MGLEVHSSAGCAPEFRPTPASGGTGRPIAGPQYVQRVTPSPGPGQARAPGQTAAGDVAGASGAEAGPYNRHDERAPVRRPPSTESATRAGGPTHGIDRAAEDVKGSGYELFILLLSILSIVNLVIIFFPPIGPIPDSARSARSRSSWTSCSRSRSSWLLYRLLSSSDKRRYFVHNYGWADLLATPPALRIFRLFRVIRVAQRLRQRGADAILNELDARRGASARRSSSRCSWSCLVVELAPRHGGLLDRARARRRQHRHP